MQNNTQTNINQLVLETFKKEFPNASEVEMQELIQDIGQTIIIESMGKLIDEVEKKDSGLAEEIKGILSTDGPNDAQAVKRILDICQMPHINIDMENIYQAVATDVVKDVLDK